MKNVNRNNKDVEERKKDEERKEGRRRKKIRVQRKYKRTGKGANRVKEQLKKMKG